MLDVVEGVGVAECFHELDFPRTLFATDIVLEGFDGVVLEHQVNGGSVVEIDEEGELVRAIPAIEFSAGNFGESLKIAIDLPFILFKSDVVDAIGFDMFFKKTVPCCMSLVESGSRGGQGNREKSAN